jgi:PPE-repeat protein
VPPTEIAANRTQLLSLLQTNLFGQNNASIAALEAEYAQFWAQDVAAVTGYAGSSQAATTGLGSFTEAPQTTNDSGQATQAATAAAAATTPAETVLEQIEADATNFLNQVTTFNADYTKFFTTALGSIPGGSTLATSWTNMYSFISGAGSQATWTNVANSTTSLGLSQWKNFFIYQPWSHGIGLGSLNGGLSSPGGHLGGLGARAATAALGSAQTVGKLSVPPSWAGATPAIRLAATSLPDAAFAATAAPTMEVPLSVLNQASLGSLAGGALGSPASRVVSSTGVRAKVTTPARSKGPVPLDKVIAKLQESPDDVQHWNVDEAGLDELVAKLSTKPGIHAVHLTDGKATAAVAKAASETG